MPENKPQIREKIRKEFNEIVVSQKSEAVLRSIVRDEVRRILSETPFWKDSTAFNPSFKELQGDAE